MNHQKSNLPVPSPTKDIAEPYSWVQLPSGDVDTIANYDDGDPIRNNKAAKAEQGRGTNEALNNPLELFK